MRDDLELPYRLATVKRKKQGYTPWLRRLFWGWAITMLCVLQACGAVSAKSGLRPASIGLVDRVVYPETVGKYRFTRKELHENSEQAVVLRYITDNSQMGPVDAVIYPFRPTSSGNHYADSNVTALANHFETIKREVFFAVKKQHYQQVSFGKEDRLKVSGVTLPVYRAIFSATNDNGRHVAVLYLALIGDHCLRVQSILPANYYRKHADQLKSIATQLMSEINVPKK